MNGAPTTEPLGAFLDIVDTRFEQTLQRYDMLVDPAIEAKEFATLQARFALAAFALNAHSHLGGTIAYRVEGPGGTRTFHSLRELERFLERVDERKLR